MPDVNVGVAWVKQQTLYYCGPAVMEMLLVTLNVARPAAPPTWQDRIWTDVENNTGASRPSGAPSTPTSPPFPQQKCEKCNKQWRCWATSPAVLQLLINQYQPTANYVMTSHATEAGATAALLDALDDQVPSVALVHGWQHWIAVEGYRYGESGSTPVAGRNLNGMFIRDPKDTQAAVHYITWAKWKSDYLDFIPCGDYAEYLLVMGGTRRAVVQTPPPQAPTNVRIVDPSRDYLVFRNRELKKIITQAQALESARKAAADLRGSSRLNPGLAAAEARWATLVQRLDDFDSYYYIVALTTDGIETARVIVDAHDGTYSEVAAIPEQGKRLPPYLPSPELKNRLAAQGDRVTSELPYQLRAGAIGDHPIPVWKPCGQSSSPFLPFYQYSIGDAFVYYRVDGERFDELTEGPA
jgi:hypothetical protein